MTDTTATQPAANSAPADATTSTSTANAAPADTTSTSANSAPADNTTTATDNKAADGAAKPGEQPPADKPADKPADAAPVEYTAPTLPEGITLVPETEARLKSTATDLKLSQEGYQKLVTQAVEYKQRLDKAINESIANVQAEWLATSKADKEIGGDNFEVNVAQGNKALNAFGTPALTAFLKETGIENHPEVRRFLLSVSKSISSDTFVDTSSAIGEKGQPITSLATAAQKMYGKT